MEKISKDTKETLFTIIGSIVSTIGLFLAVMAATFSLKNPGSSLFTLAGSLIMAGGNRVILFFKEKTKLEKIKNMTLACIYTVLAILVPFGSHSVYFLSVPLVFFCVSVIANRIFKIIIDHKPQSIVINGLVIIFAFLYGIIFLNPNVFLAQSEYPVTSIIIIFFAIILMVTAFKDVIAFVFSRFKFKIFFTIIKKTFATEILAGLVVLMFAFSIILTVTEPTLNNFADALWYCFAVVTTIGFGDFTCTSVIGRILTVLLGIYGIIVVALITSIIVNFYNETSAKSDAAKIKQAQKEAVEDYVEKKQIERVIDELSKEPESKENKKEQK